jgi:hypothetical protein
MESLYQQGIRHYFSAHPIVVVNEGPLSNILNNPEATGRVSHWGIELSPRDITYEKIKAIKSQILPDFVAEWMELQNTGPPDLSSTWHMNFDGSKRVEGAGAGVILVSPQGDKMKYILRMTFPNASNNEADIGMPKGHVAYLPLVYSWSTKPMDSKT